jgi:hypothetical protein
MLKYNWLIVCFSGKGNIIQRIAAKGSLAVGDQNTCECREVPKRLQFPVSPILVKITGGGFQSWPFWAPARPIFGPCYRQMAVKWD